MVNSNLIKKELVKTFAYTTVSQSRDAYTNVVIDGRNYLKYGQLQAVTIAGFMYKIYNSELGVNEYFLYCGISKQHPCDTKLNKETGYEQAAINAQMNPFFEMKVEKQFSDYTFRRMMTNYVDHLNLEFIKTTQEIKKQCKNTSIYSR